MWGRSTKGRKAAQFRRAVVGNTERLPDGSEALPASAIFRHRLSTQRLLPLGWKGSILMDAMIRGGEPLRSENLTAMAACLREFYGRAA